jgi:hypothetical protein
MRKGALSATRLNNYPSLIRIVTQVLGYFVGAKSAQGLTGKKSGQYR